MKIEKKSSLNPYLTFDGNCQKAMEFYASALEAELNIFPFRGSAAEKDVPEEHKDKVMHATLSCHNIVLMASDAMPGQPVMKGNNMALSIASTNREEAVKFFQNLSKGGNVIMPFEKTFWGAEFGMCTDRFGFQWMVNYELPSEK